MAPKLGYRVAHVEEGRLAMDTLALDRLGDEIAELSAHLDAATARLLDLIREFDAREGWNTGFRSCAAWLSWRGGLDLGAARGRVRVARTLGTLPPLAQALARGELSYAQVRALTRVAAARETLYQRARPQHGDAGPVDVSSETPTMAQQQADALALLAETSLHHGIDPGAPAERYQVVVHVDAPALADPDQPGQSVLEDGARVPAETSQRLACDASRVVMQHGGDGRVVEVGARTRTIPPAIRRALHHRDRGCRFPGCGVRFGQGHHIRHWANGGPTTLSNLALLCRRHHRAVHEEGYQSCPRSRRLPRYLAIPCTRYVRATRQTGSTWTRGPRCRAGWGNGSTWATRSASCIRWRCRRRGATRDARRLSKTSSARRRPPPCSDRPRVFRIVAVGIEP